MTSSPAREPRYRRARSTRVFDVRAGDQWAFTTNNGEILRDIRYVGREEVGYTCNGVRHVCLRSTFKRWWRGASLFYADDWEGRDEQGETTPPEADSG